MFYGPDSVGVEGQQEMLMWRESLVRNGVSVR